MFPNKMLKANNISTPSNQKLGDEERMDMFEYFAKERIQEDQRRREAREYLTRPPLTPQVIHHQTEEASILETSTTTPPPPLAGKYCIPPLPPNSLGSRDYLFQSKFVQNMKIQWEDKMKQRNPSPPTLHKCGHLLMTSHQDKINPPPPSIPLIQPQENFQSHYRVHKSIETQPLPTRESEERKSTPATPQVIHNIKALNNNIHETRETQDTSDKLISTTHHHHERHSLTISPNAKNEQQSFIQQRHTLPLAEPHRRRSSSPNTRHHHTNHNNFESTLHIKDTHMHNTTQDTTNTTGEKRISATQHERRHSSGNPKRPSFLLLPPPPPPPPPPSSRKVRRSLVQQSVEGLLPVVQHIPEFTAPQQHLPHPVHELTSATEESVEFSTLHHQQVDEKKEEEFLSKKRRNTLGDFDLTSYVSRISSDSDTEMERVLNEEKKKRSSAVTYNGNYGNGQTYSLVSRLSTNKDHHRVSIGDQNKAGLTTTTQITQQYRRHSIPQTQSNSRRISDFEESDNDNDNYDDDDDESKSSIALEVEGLKHPRRATATATTLHDELLLLSLNKDFNDTIQQEIETKSDQVYKSKSENNLTNGTNMEAIAKSLSQENMYPNNPTRQPTNPGDNNYTRNITTKTTTISVHEKSESDAGKGRSHKLSTTLLRKNSSGLYICHGCKKLVKPEDHSFQITDGVPHVWHQSCFVCKTCHIQLGHMDHLFYEEEPYCYQHYILIAHVPTCRGCGEHIFDPSYTSAAGSYWHKDHFVCQSCRIPLVDTKYVQVHGHVFCFSCHEKEFSKMCETCHKKILPREFYVQSGQYFWHSNDNCLHCETCQQSLVGHALFFRRDKKLFCNRYCAMRRDSAFGKKDCEDCKH